MATRNLLNRASIVYTYIEASGHTVDEIAERMGMTRMVLTVRLGEKQHNNRIIYAIGEIIGVDLSFLVRECEGGRNFRRNG